MSCSIEDPHLAELYGIVMAAGMVLVVYVMSKTWHNPYHRMASMRLQTVRYFSFIVMAALLGYSGWSSGSWFSISLLLASGLVALLINAVSLSRTPPKRGTEVYAGGWALSCRAVECAVRLFSAIPLR